MSALVEDSVYRSVLSLADKDPQQAQRVLQNEAGINRMEIEIDDLATRLLALFQPMARDLRFLTSAIKINTDLERMGDMAVNITERSLTLMKEPAIRPLIDIPKIAELAQGMVHNALDAFAERDADLARQVLRSDDEVDRLRDAVYDELLEFMQEESGTINRSVALMFIAQNLERIADHATNIAEDVLFMVKGIDVRHRAETTD